MNTDQLSLIALRVIAIYLIAQSISAIPSAYTTLTMMSSFGSGESAIGLALISTLVTPLTIGVILWIFAPRLSKHLAPSNEISNEKNELTTKQFQTTAMLLIGVYLLAINIPQALSINYLLLQSDEFLSGFNKNKSEIILSAIVINLKIILALLLTFKTKSLVTSLNKIRTIGTK